MASFAYGSDSPDRLLWLIHHAAVDGVSWRILLEDLHAACQQLAADGSVRLPARGTSLKGWAERLHAWAGSAEAMDEAAYWLTARPPELRPLPIDISAGENTVASVAMVAGALTSEATQALLTKVTARFKVQINDVLLTALATAVAAWSGHRPVLVLLEGHGREPIGEGMDLSRTVGWFTSLFPVSIAVSAGADVSAALAATHAALSQMPRRGVGYGALRYLAPDDAVRARLREPPEPQISFNYLGQVDQGIAFSAPWRLACEGTGEAVAAATPRPVLLEVNSQIVGGRFQVRWFYSRNRHRASTVQKLCDAMLEALAALIERARADGLEALAVAPAAEFHWSAEDLDDIAAALDGSTA
jgi:non-ribosomal peptide synthase protein (TIGR01720 family)